MVQIYTTYHEEKMMEFREREIREQLRSGRHVRSVESKEAKDGEGTGGSSYRPSVWQRWFGSRRLDASMK